MVPFSFISVFKAWPSSTPSRRWRTLPPATASGGCIARNRTRWTPYPWPALRVAFEWLAWMEHRLGQDGAGRTVANGSEVRIPAHVKRSTGSTRPLTQSTSLTDASGTWALTYLDAPVIGRLVHAERQCRMSGKAADVEHPWLSRD